MSRSISNKNCFYQELRGTRTDKYQDNMAQDIQGQVDGCHTVMVHKTELNVQRHCHELHDIRTHQEQKLENIKMSREQDLTGIKKAWEKELYKISRP